MAQTDQQKPEKKPAGQSSPFLDAATVLKQYGLDAATQGFTDDDLNPVTFLDIPLTSTPSRRAGAQQLLQRQKAVAAAVDQLNLAGLQAKIQQETDLQNAIGLAGGRTPNSMTPMAQSLMESLGLTPTATEQQPVHNEPILGPTQPIFQQGQQGQGEAVMDEFGLMTQPGQPQVTDFGQSVLDQTINRPGAFEALTGSVNAASPAAEQLARQFDPGLQPPLQDVQVPNMEGEVSDAGMRQIGQMLDVALRTPQGKSDAVAPEQIDQMFGSLESALGLEPGSIQRPQTALPSSAVNALTGNVAQAAAKRLADQQKEQRQQAYFGQQERMLTMKNQLADDLMVKSKTIDLNNAKAIKQVMFEHQQAIETGRADARMQQIEQQAKLNLDNRLKVLEQQQDFAAGESQLGRDAQMLRQTLRGEQAINLETLRAANRVALADNESVIDSNKILEKFYGDLMKSNPAIASQFADILSNVPTDQLDPQSSDAMREALRKRLDEITNSQVVDQALDTIVNTDIFGNGFDEKRASLYRHIQKFNAQGIDTSKMLDQLNYMEEIAVNKTQEVKPIGTPGEREDISALRSILTDIDFLGQMYDSGYTGFADDLMAKGKSFMGLIGGREELFRSAVDDLKARIIRARAGAAISPTEASLLLASIPTLDSSDTRFLSNMQNLQRTTRSLLNDRYSLMRFSAKDRFEELKMQGKSNAEIEQTLMREGMIPPRSAPSKDEK